MANEPATSIKLESESDKFATVSVVAVSPTWRDIWSILRGRYRPLVVRRTALTLEGVAQILKRNWTGEKVESALYRSNPLYDMWDRMGTDTE